MSNDERAQGVSPEGPYDEADTTQTRVQPDEAAEPAPAESTSRWERVSQPARSHPIGLAVGTALAGLVIGLLGGLALNVHPMMSLQVGTAPALTAVDGQGPGPGGDRHGPGGEGRHGGPGGPGAERGPGGPGAERGPGGPGAERGPGGPGAERGPDGQDAPPPPPGGPRGPGAEGQGPGNAQRPDAPPPPADGTRPPAPPSGSDAPRPANPGGDAPQQPPLPAERGSTGQTSGT